MNFGTANCSYCLKCKPLLFVGLFPCREFLNIALGLLDECHRTNEDMAQQLLTYNLDNWGDQCCLSLAVATRHEEFVAHTCCQTLLTKIWMGAMKMGEWASLKVRIDWSENESIVITCANDKVTCLKRFFRGVRLITEDHANNARVRCLALLVPL